MGALSRTEILPLEDYVTGTRNSNEHVIADDASRLVIEFERCVSARSDVWANPATKIHCRLEVSFDAGQTWVFAGAFSAQGGVHLQRDGSELPVTSVSVPIPHGKNRRLRYSLAVENGPFRSKGSLEQRDGVRGARGD